MQDPTVVVDRQVVVSPGPTPPAPSAARAGAAVGDATSPAAAYAAFTAQATILRQQLEGSLDQRSEEIAKLTNMSGNDFADARTGVQARIARLDKRISGLEEQIQQVDAQTAAAAGVPGAVEPDRPARQGGDEAENFFGGTGFGILLVTAFLFARRRFWKRTTRGMNNSGNLQLPAEISGRMERLENIAEATALEVERIGEGQRFVTKLLSEQQQKLPVK